MGSQLSIMSTALLWLVFIICSADSSYLPPYYEGTPTAVSVVTLDSTDFRGQDVYRIEFSLQVENSTFPDEGFIHRSWEDFKDFDRLLKTHLLHFGLHLPDTQSVETLDSYLKSMMSHPAVVSSNVFSDFLGINWSGSDLKFLQSLPEFFRIVIPPLYRAPDFAPEPPVFDNEADTLLAPETPFEVFVYLKAFRSQTNLAGYLEFFNSYLNTNPAFTGPEDNSDVQPPGEACPVPHFYNLTYVHFLPGGYLNGHTCRISYLGKSKFNFLDENKIEEWVTMLHGDKNPKRILDIGTGPGFSAFVLSEIFPEAEVIGVDLSAPYIRMARTWQTLRNATNVQFYQATAEDLSWLESETFDLINYAYVLHEMPALNALNIINEIHRLLRPGGTMNGFEIPFIENEINRQIYSLFNTWGHNWEDGGAQGPEPYMHEYLFGTLLIDTLQSLGFSDIDFAPYSYFEGIFTATK